MGNARRAARSAALVALSVVSRGAVSRRVAVLVLAVAVASAAAAVLVSPALALGRVEANARPLYAHMDVTATTCDSAADPVTCQAVVDTGNELHDDLFIIVGALCAVSVVPSILRFITGRGA